MPNKESVTIVVRWVKVVDVHGDTSVERCILKIHGHSPIIITTSGKKWLNIRRFALLTHTHYINIVDYTRNRLMLQIHNHVLTRS